jgi:hypothetical protein
VTENATTTRAPTGRPSLPHADLIVLLLAVAISGAVVIWLLLRHDGLSTTLPPPGSGPALVTRAQLEHLPKVVDQPVYWAGPKSGYSYELTRTSTGRIFVRYLPKGVAAGDPRANFLVVGTYSRAGSFEALKQVANRNGSVRVALPNNGLMVESSKPQSVYIGYPGANYQIEVYSPASDTAHRLVLKGTIVPIK